MLYNIYSAVKIQYIDSMERFCLLSINHLMIIMKKNFSAIPIVFENNIVN